MGDSPDDRVIRSYLLGEMSAEERAAFQQRLFEDNDLFQRVLAAETDLADDLARGELSPADAARVRAFLEESSQGERVPIAQALARTSMRHSSPALWRRALPLAACILLAVATVWLALRNRDLETRVAQFRPAPQVAAGSLAISVPAGVVRGPSSRPVIDVPPGVKVIELRLELRSPGTHAAYRVEIARASAQPVFSLTLPAPLPSELSIPVPRAALSAGAYEIVLSGIDDGSSPTPVDFYYITVR